VTLLAADRGEVTPLGFLDLSAAFDTVDHKILLDHLHVTYGLHGQALDWIHSFVSNSNRAQSVSFAGTGTTRKRPWTDNTDFIWLGSKHQLAKIHS